MLLCSLGVCAHASVQERARVLVKKGVTGLKGVEYLLE